MYGQRPGAGTRARETPSKYSILAGPLRCQQARPGTGSGVFALRLHNVGLYGRFPGYPCRLLLFTFLDVKPNTSSNVRMEYEPRGARVNQHLKPS